MFDVAFLFEILNLVYMFLVQTMVNPLYRTLYIYIYIYEEIWKPDVVDEYIV